MTTPLRLLPSLIRYILQCDSFFLVVSEFYADDTFIADISNEESSVAVYRQVWCVEEAYFVSAQRNGILRAAVGDHGFTIIDVTVFPDSQDQVAVAVQYGHAAMFDFRHK